LTKNTCPLRDEFCPEHDFVHGREAEELREGIKDLLEDGDDDDEAGVLRRGLSKLLDKVDARDSVAWLDANKRKQNAARDASVSGVCVPVCGEEENYLQFFPWAGNSLLGITDLLEKADAESIPWRLANALETPNEPHYSAMVEQYRTASGRAYPALYRVRIHVVVEDVSDEDSEKLWKEFDRFEQGDDA
jgi:hypothetical protein